MKRKLFLIVAALLLSGTMFAQAYHWDGFDYHAFQSHMSITGRVYLDGVIQQNRGDIEVATFVGDELRGTEFLWQPYPSSTLGYFIWTSCFYDSEGETFTFKAYDHASGIEYEICDTQLTGIEGGYGDVDNPVIMHFTSVGNSFSGPSYPWTPVSYPGEGMLVVAQVKINGELVNNGNWEVGAFCNDECRGISDGLDDFTSDGLGFFAFMNVLGNEGDLIEFYLYDKTNAKVYEAVCPTTLTLTNGSEIGIDIFGGDIFVLDFETAKTFTKNILAYTPNTKDHYYLIATPINTIDPTKVLGMLDNQYDLYYFNQSGDAEGKEWINYKSSDGNYDLEPGKGYLYANSGNVTLTFKGFPYTGETQFSLAYDDNADLKGWNLVGNPFTVDAYINKDYYRMNGEGTEVETGSGAIGVMEGVFVCAENANDVLTFSDQAPTKANEQLVLSLNSNRGSSIDRAIVRFNNSSLLPKFQINEDNTKLYIPQNGKDYAIVNAEDHGELPVHFKAAKNGNYTISFNTENVTMGYLHLIDNRTGDDIDLLATPSYTFDAKTTDYESRFKLVFATGNASDDNFGFFSNGNLVINNEGAATLQVIDITGRIISSESINGCYSKTVDAAAGVYMLRLINGDNVKTQKIVLN